MEQLDDCLSIRDGALYVEGCSAPDLVRRFGSPLFVFSEDQLARNVRRFQDAFRRGWSFGPVKVLPAVKANWISAVQRVLCREGCGADVYSPGELTVALEAGFDPASISVNGVPKDYDHVERAILSGARLTIDSLEEVDWIERVVRETGTVARVRIRLKPVLDSFSEPTDFAAEGLVPTDLAALAYKGGLIFDDAVHVARRIRVMPRVELVGFHQHHGRHHRSTGYWAAQMRAFAREVAKVCEAIGNYRPLELDIGGGFAIPRDPHNAMTHYADPVQLSMLYALSKGLKLLGEGARYRTMRELVNRLVEIEPNKVPAPSIEEYAGVCTQTLAAELRARGITPEGITLQLEPGRSLHGNAGVHLATVRAIKRMESPIRWNVVVLDTTEFWLTGGRYEHHLHDFRVANKASAAREEKADIVGRSCYGDRILPTVRVPRMEVGDVFAFLDTGAYQEVSCSNFNALPRPAALLVTGAEAAVIRRAETEAEVFQRDQIPDHLRSERRNKVVEHLDNPSLFPHRV